jgi:hypothetical protein
MSYLAIIYFPENERRQPGLPFGMRGDRLFNYQVERAAPKKTNGNTLEKIEQESIVLRRGLNFVEAEGWEGVQRHPVNVEAINLLLKLQALIIHTPDSPELAAKDSTDFADESVVQELVENCANQDWLNLCLNCDRRIPIRQVITNRLKDLAEEESVRRQQMVGAMSSMR